MFGPLRANFMWSIYTSYFKRSHFSTTDPLFVLLVIGCFSLMFWRFFAFVSLYVVDMIAYYTITLFEYWLLYIQTDKILLIMVM
jgi:hypothetical protein